MKFFYKYIIHFIVFIFSITPVFWVIGKGNILINGVDTNFPLDPVVWFDRRFFVWNSITNAGNDFSSSIAGLFFHLIQVIPYVLGFSLHDTQVISFIFWFSLIVGFSYILAKQIIPRQSLIQLLFVCLYSFNIFLFNTWENVKVANLSLMAGIPLALTILFLLKENKLTRIQGAICLVFVSIVVSGTGINPAYFISFFLVLFLYLISEGLSFKSKEAVINRVKDFLLLGLVVVLVNFFWILPTGFFIISNIPVSGSIDGIGFNNWVDSLSENTSLLNIMRMQGAWDWYAFDSVTGLPLYIPYALNYFYNNSFIIFSFLLTGLALFGLLLHDKKKENLYIHFGLMLIIGVFLGAGTHLPTGDLFRWFVVNVPFFSLFRSPWYIFTPLVILALAGLVSLFFNRLFDLYENKEFVIGSRWNIAVRGILYTSVLILIIGNLLYAYPLVTGKIFRPSQPNNFLVKFPDYVFESGKWLESDNNGRIIGYPDNEIEEFTWGYRGIESILSLLVDRDVLFSPLNAPDSPVAILIKEFYLNLKKGQIDSAKAIAAKLNIGLIHQKNDQKSITLPLPAEVKKYPKSSFGLWDFYKFPYQEYLPKIFATNEIYLAGLTYADKSFINALANKDLLLNTEDKEVRAIPNINNISSKLILTNNLQLKELRDFQISPSRLATRLRTRDLSICNFTFEIPEDGIYEPIIEKYRLQDFGLDISKGLDLEIDNTKTLWNRKSVTDSYLHLEPLFLKKGSHKIVLKLENNNLVIGGNFESGMIFVKGGEGRGEGIYEIDESTPNKFLSVYNIDKADISADFKVTPFDPLGFYYIEARYKQIYGNNTNILVSQSNKTTLFKAQVERMPNHPEWKLASFYYEPVKVDSDMYVALLAPHVSDPLGTKILYDDLKVQKVFTNQLLFVKKANQESKDLFSEPVVEFSKISPTEYQANVRGANKPHVIVFSENYSPDWLIEVFQSNGEKALVKQHHFSANLYANAWYLEGTPDQYQLKIIHKSQILVWIGFVVSGITVLLIITIFIRSVKKGKKNL